MYGDNEEKKCSLCFYSSQAKGLSDKLYCEKKREYRPIWQEACDDYMYDIIKRPVRRRKTNFGELSFDI